MATISCRFFLCVYSRVDVHAAGVCSFEWTGQTERYRGTHIQTQSHLFTLRHKTHICQREVLLPGESKWKGNVICWMGGQAHTRRSANTSRSIDCWGISWNADLDDLSSLDTFNQPAHPARMKRTRRAGQTRLWKKHQWLRTFTQVQ